MKAVQTSKTVAPNAQKSGTWRLTV